MYCRVLACDFDGTSAENGQLAPEVAAALSAARAQGIVTLLVTGRVHEEVEALCRDLSSFDAVVAENGAIVCLLAQNRTIQMGEPPPEWVLGALRARNVPFHVGAVVVGTWARHTAEALEVIRRFAADTHLSFNRESLMLLPSGVNKASGTKRALEELGRSEHNLIAFGDAENDIPLLSLAEIGVAPWGSVPTVAARADARLNQPGGSGVARYVHELIDRGCFMTPPPRRRLVLGRDSGGEPVALPVSSTNVMISGDPRAGKSWLLGLMAEQLVEGGYRICVIDPEGDCVSLADRPRVVLFGQEINLPPPAAAVHLLHTQPISLVFNLSALSQSAQAEYVDRLLTGLERSAEETGIPQWILVDEAHCFFHAGARWRRLDGPISFVFATYRSSLIDDQVLRFVQAHLVTRTTVEEERYFVTSLFRARGPRDLSAAEALAEVDLPRAGLLLEDEANPRWQVFTPSVRLTAHAHHARKYAEAYLPESKAFRFLGNGHVAAVAHNVVEFAAAVQGVPVDSLRHHLSEGDLSRWAGDVLGDDVLARGLRKLERAVRVGAEPDRLEILAHLRDQYRI